MESAAYRVGLNHGSHKAERKNHGNGKKARQKLSELVVERFFDIVNGTADNFSVLADNSCFLRKNRFRINGRHTEKRNYPHPEYRTRTAYKYCAARAHYITCSDLRGNRRGKSLERSQIAAVTLSVQRNFSENAFHALAKTAHLNKTRSYREKYTRSDKQKNEYVVRQISVNGRNDLVKKIHISPFLFEKFFRLTFLNRLAERERKKISPRRDTPTLLLRHTPKVETKKSVCKKTDRFGFIRGSVLLPERFALLRFHLRHPLEAGFSRSPSICGPVPFGKPESVTPSVA